MKSALRDRDREDSEIRSVGSGRGPPPTALTLNPSHDSARTVLCCSDPGAAQELSQESSADDRN
eukprot:847499-Alexandrium_andersonii.AAC.1